MTEQEFGLVKFISLDCTIDIYHPLAMDNLPSFDGMALLLWV
jgi:hypothetical protein